MKLNDFVQFFKSTKNKEQFVKEHIKTTYLPYEDKISLCKEIADRTMWITVNDKQVFSVNSPMRYMLFVQGIVQYYTDIEIPDDGESRLLAFNEFEKNGITSYLPEAIGSDYKALNTVLSMVYDDVIANETNLITYFDRKLKAASLSFDTMIAAAAEVIQQQTKSDGDNNVVEFKKPEESEPDNVDQV